MYNKSRSNITLNGENWKEFLKKSKRQGYLLSPILQYSVEFLARTIKQEKEIKGMLIKEEVKLTLLTDNKIVYLKGPKDFTKKLRSN
jgi:hypothetical protein